MIQKINRKKVVITGGTGLLASNIAYYKKIDWEILLLTRNHTLFSDGIQIAKADLMDKESTARLIENFAPNMMIHTAGLANVEECEENFYKAYLANVVITKNISEICQSLSIPMVHISTDHFANEDKETSSEQDIGHTKNHYAETKLLAESTILNHHERALIIRTNFFGWGHRGRTSFSDFIIENLRNNKPITLFDDVYYTPVFIDDLTDSIEKLMEKGCRGIFNICSNKKITKYEFGMAIAEIFELDAGLIHRGNLRDQKMTKRPFNMALSNHKLVEHLGKDFDFDFRQSIKKLKDVEFEGRSIKLKEAINLLTQNHKEEIFYGKHFIDERDVDSVLQTLANLPLTQGNKVEEFEEKFAQYTGSSYAVAFANLTCGLHAGYLAMGIKSGDLVLTTPLSFVATSNALLYIGATPVFVDIDFKTLNIDLDQVEEALKFYKGKIKALSVVHFAGHPVDMVRVKKIADEYRILVLEDAAHAAGGNYSSGEKIGNGQYSAIQGFSFHPVKNVTTGEGAMLTTNDSEIYKQLCRLRSHGINKGNDQFQNKDLALTDGLKNLWYYEQQYLGFNYRLTDLQSSLGISQLNKLDCFTEKRKEIGAYYDAAFRSMDHVTLFQDSTRAISGNHLYVIGLDYEKHSIVKNHFYQHAKSKGINLHVHYIPIHLQPYYNGTQKKYEQFGELTQVMKYYQMATTLPFYPTLKKGQVDRVVDLISSFGKS